FRAFRVSMLTGSESGPWHRPCNYERHDGQLDFNNYRAALTLKGDTTNVELLAHEEKGARQSARLHAHRADDRGGHHRYPRGHRDPAVRQRPDARPRRQGPGRLPDPRLGHQHVHGPHGRPALHPSRLLFGRLASGLRRSARTGTLTRLPGRGRVTAPVRTYSPDGGGGMARSGLLRRLFTASMAVLFGLAALTTAAHAQTKGGVIRVGNLGEPPALDAHWTTASITETLTNHIYEGLFSLD